MLLWYERSYGFNSKRSHLYIWELQSPGARRRAHSSIQYHKNAESAVTLELSAALGKGQVGPPTACTLIHSNVLAACSSSAESDFPEVG